MKKIKLLFISSLVLLYSYSNSQTKISFVDTTAIWSVAKTYPNANAQYPNFIETKTILYGYSGDTLIGGDLWLKMYSTFDSSFSSNLTLLGNIRVVGSLILFMDTLANVDTIYNFNINIGDSVLYNLGQDIVYLEIENIDSILINNVYHKRFFIEEPNSPPLILNEVWVEGIGSIRGGPLFPKYYFLSNPYEFSDSVNLLCYKNNNSVLWQNTSYSGCYINNILSINKNINNKNALNVYPNPSKNKLIIEYNFIDFNTINVEIYNANGCIVLSEVLNNSKLVINTNELNQGIYYILIKNDQKLIKTTKWVKI